jgi:hypothetical protein
MRVPPFYSLLRGMAVEDLWHDNDACQIGQRIGLANRRPGRDHPRKHCALCAVHNARELGP